MTASFLPTYRDFPVSKPEELERVLVQSYIEIAQAANVKENSQYQTVETVNGQQFYGILTTDQTRFVYRKCFQLGAIVAGTTVNIAHGIAPLVGFANMYGTVATSSGDWRPIPYVPTVTEYITFVVTTTNIIIAVSATSPSVTSGLIVLEYFKS
jgi:hypothetical protein